MAPRIAIAACGVLLVSAVTVAPAHAQPACPAEGTDNYSGSVPAGGSVTIPLMLAPCETVTYVVTTNTSAQYGAAAGIRFYNSSGTQIFSDAWFMNKSATVTLPRTAPHIVPFRASRGAAGRPASVALRSDNYGFSYTLLAMRTRRPDHNLGGTSFDDARPIAPYETQYGTVHHLEGSMYNLGGQYYSIVLQPQQAIHISGTALGHSGWGGNLAIQLYDPNRAYIRDLVNVAGYGQISFPSAGQLRVFVHTGTQAATYYLRIYAPVWVCHDFSFTVKTPRLTAVPAEPVRGTNASLVVEDAVGATASAWRLVTPQGTVTRQSTGSLTWTGTVVMGGDASVSVNLGGQTFTLQRALSVLPRNAFVSPPVPAEDSNAAPPDPPVWMVICGGEYPFADPPASGGALGQMCLQTGFTFHTSARLADNGPNHGFFYVTDYQDTTRFRWWLHPYLNDTASTFYQAQYGNYNGTTGYISGSQLVSNTREHESGTIRGHYQQYRASVADNDLNPGRQVEEEVGGPGVPSTAAFVAQVSNALSAISAAILSNTTQEHYPCNSFVNYSPLCEFNGPINYHPYQPQ